MHGAHWAGITDWADELAPYIDQARRMLGVVPIPYIDTQVDRLMREVAGEMGRGNTYDKAPVGVYFGTPGVEADDPYFGGEGPRRRGCIGCGNCMIGCGHNAKNGANFHRMGMQNGRFGSIAPVLTCRRHVRLAANLGSAGCPGLPVEGIGLDVIQAPKPEPRIMRYELTDFEWAAIRPFLPNKPHGIPRVDDRRVLNGIFWVLRSGAPWRDLPASYGPRTTCYNRFVRWLQAGVWDRIMDALAADHDPTVQMIDTSIVRVHRHGACIADNNQQDVGRSRGGLTSKIHAIVDANGLQCISPSRPVRPAIVGSVRSSSA